jgi:hypothetical protein
MLKHLLEDTLDILAASELTRTSQSLLMDGLVGEPLAPEGFLQPHLQQFAVCTGLQHMYSNCWEIVFSILDKHRKSRTTAKSYEEQPEFMSRCASSCINGNLPPRH